MKEGRGQIRHASVEAEKGRLNRRKLFHLNLLFLAVRCLQGSCVAGNGELDVSSRPSNDYSERSQTANQVRVYPNLNLLWAFTSQRRLCQRFAAEMSVEPERSWLLLSADFCNQPGSASIYRQDQLLTLVVEGNGVNIGVWSLEYVWLTMTKAQKRCVIPNSKSGGDDEMDSRAGFRAGSGGRTSVPNGIAIRSYKQGKLKMYWGRAKRQFPGIPNPHHNFSTLTPSSNSQLCPVVYVIARPLLAGWSRGQTESAKLVLQTGTFEILSHFEVLVPCICPYAACLQRVDIVWYRNHFAWRKWRKEFH